MIPGRLDIIVPCYNPSINWHMGLCVNFIDIKHQLQNVETNLILVNDGSTKNVEKDHIEFIEQQLGEFSYISSQHNRGKGNALRLGVNSSEAEYIIFTDVDFPYELKSVIDIFNSLQKGSDVSLGYRDETYYEHVPFLRKVISKILRKNMSYLLNLVTSDTQCGLKGFNYRGKEEFLRTQINRFLFDLEFVKRCSQRKDFKVSKVSVNLKEGVEFSRVKLKILITETLNFIGILLKKD